MGRPRTARTILPTALAAPRPDSGMPRVAGRERSDGRKWTTPTPFSLLLLSAALGLAGCSWMPWLGKEGDPGVLSSSKVSYARWQAAMAEARTGQATSEDEPYWPYRMAELYVEVDSTARALDELGRSLEIDRDYNPSLSLWSKLLYERQRYAEAISGLEAARVRQGELPEALRLGLALNYEAAERYGESDAEFEASGQQPSSAAVYHLLRGEGFLEAGALAKKALREAPGSAANQNNYGITRLYDGDPESAKEAFLEALRLNPAMPGPMYNLAIVETFYFFDRDAGREWYRRYREVAIDDPDGLGEVFADVTSPPVMKQAAR